jgi:phenylalanine-4-hydroxylase
VSRTEDRVPAHLRHFVVEQDAEAYSAIDHAVWRFVLLQLYDRLQRTAHPAYVRGFSQAGMSTARVPRIADMDACLSEFGWGAVCVDGFIPPRAFQEFQALGILPIAADMRTVEHLPYTPAPDIIHEAAGHAPILPDPEYAAFLRRVGECGMRAFACEHDRTMFQAIRRLSIVKEQRDATPAAVASAELALAELVARAPQPSEAAQLARLYWWTVEYGLVGTPDDYRMYGAGLLSSLAESHFCAEPSVAKRPLSAACVAVDYDITRPQPQLFVARDFAQLGEVLDEVCAAFAFRCGGMSGLRAAQVAAEVATIELGCGVQLTGTVQEVIGDGALPRALLLRGACAIGARERTLPGHGREAYPNGMVVALDVVPASAFIAGARVRFELGGGAAVEGIAERASAPVREGLSATPLREARFLHGAQPVVLLGECALLQTANARVTSVRAGASDADYWPAPPPTAHKAPRRAGESERQRALRQLYERVPEAAPDELCAVHDALQRDHAGEWLLRWNLLERLIALDAEAARRAQIERELWQLEQHFAGRHPVAMGLRYLRCAPAE